MNCSFEFFSPLFDSHIIIVAHFWTNMRFLNLFTLHVTHHSYDQTLSCDFLNWLFFRQNTRLSEQDSCICIWNKTEDTPPAVASSSWEIYIFRLLFIWVFILQTYQEVKAKRFYLLLYFISLRIFSLSPLNIYVCKLI